MTLDVAHAAIRQRFATIWDAGPPQPAVQYPNVEFTAPDDASWVRLIISTSGNERASLGDPGNNVDRNFGQVTMQIFTLAGVGEGEALGLADKAKGVFRDWEDAVSGVRFLVPPYARLVGGEGKWYQINVVAPFQFDDFN